jgi:hypothetical protein
MDIGLSSFVHLGGNCGERATGSAAMVLDVDLLFTLA